MKLKINKEFPRFSLSSENINYADIHDYADSITKIKNNRSSLHHSKKSNNKLLSIIPSINTKINFNNSSLNEPIFQKSKRIRINNISSINSKKKYNNSPYLNNLYNESNLNGSKISMADNPLKIKLKKSKLKKALNQPLYRESSKTNLKLIQKELQFKLLDMSMQIENGLDLDDEESNYFSNLKNENQSKILGQKVKNELEMYKKEIKNSSKKSLNVNDIKPIYSINNFYNVKGNILSKTVISKGISLNKNNNNERFKGKNNNNYLNITSFRNELSKNNININKNNKRKNYTIISNNLNNIIMNKDNISMKWNNKSMSINKNNISINKNLNYNSNKEFENKFRSLIKKKELYDSFEDEEIIEELEDKYFYISPETKGIFIFDEFILFCNLFCCFYYPIYIGKNICFCSYISSVIKVILFFTDLINIIDILLSFFRAYYNFEYRLIKKTDRIVIHYLKKYLFTDFISAIPVFSYSCFLCKTKNYNEDICFSNGIDLKYNLLKMSLGLKIMKIFKIMDKKANRGIKYFYDIISENYTLEKTMKMLLFIILCVLGFNIFICYHIFIGKLSYPSWIIKTNNQDKNFFSLYMISCYFMITTITSVGYGDITCASIGETFFQIIVLTIGVIAYSWVVSTIGNYVKNETKAAIKYNKDIDLLEEIRVSYPKMSFKLYNKIQKHLEIVSHQQEKFDINLLVNNLPYYLKNKLMFIIYENIIKKFNFFKECENSDFILRILTSFIPFSSRKGAFVIHEGELVDNIIFVKEGRLSLTAAIDLDNPLFSIDSYLGEKFEDINEKMETNLDNSIMTNKSTNNIGLKIQKAKTELKYLFKTKDNLNNSNIEQELAKYNFDEDEFDNGNYQFLNILDILKNEHYGEVYMFLQKPSPLSLRVKSKYSELFLLRKQETLQITKAYPNVWKKIYQISYHNMKSIKKLTKRIIIHYCNNYGIRFDNKKGIDFLRNDSDNNFISNLGLLNQKKRTNRRKKVKFNLDKSIDKITGSFPIPQKTILKNKLEKLKTLESNKISSYLDEFNPPQSNLKKSETVSSENKKGFINRKKTKYMERMKTLSYNIKLENNKVSSYNNYFRSSSFNKNSILKNQLISNNRYKNFIKIKKSYTNSINNRRSSYNNIFRVRSILKNINRNNTKKNNNGYSNIKKDSNINNNILEDEEKTEVLNTSNYEESKSIKINKPFKKINLNVIRCNSFNIKSNNKNKQNIISTFSIKDHPLKKTPILKVNDENLLNDNKIMHKSSIKDSIVSQTCAMDSEGVFEKPNTIKNLSRPLIKKIQRKIKKRKKMKKIYKILIPKITEPLIRINPNVSITLNTSMNNSFGYTQKNDINNIKLINELQNNCILQDNTIISHGVNIKDGEPQINGQKLLIIPESSEFNSESSSENSKSSNKSNSISVKKKEIEISISENFNFNYSNTYENLNSISEGYYSKDENLRKSVMKLIGIYLKEKFKNKNHGTSIGKTDFSLKNIIKNEKEEKENENYSKKRNSIVNNKKEKNTIIKNKEENSKKDVWAFLNEDKPEKEFSFKLDSSKSKDSSFNAINYYSKTPKLDNFKKNIKSKKNNFNFFCNNLKEENNNSPKSKKKKESSKKKILKNRKSDVLNIKKCTTIIHSKKMKKSFKKEKYKSNKKNTNYENNNQVKEITLNNNNASTISSLDLSLDNFDQREAYLKNFYKTYQNKKKKKIEEDLKSDSKLDDISNKGLNIK